MKYVLLHISKPKAFLIFLSFALFSHLSFAQQSTFPFDTAFSKSPITVARYGLSFVIFTDYGPAICPICQTSDFRLTNSSLDTTKIKFPKDSSRLIVACYDFNCVRTIYRIDTSYSTHEYRFKANSLNLYMQVLSSAKPDSIAVRFDTVSFLTNTHVENPVPKSSAAPSFVSLVNNFGKADKTYDIRGRIIKNPNLYKGILFQSHGSKVRPRAAW